MKVTILALAIVIDTDDPETPVPLTTLAPAPPSLVQMLRQLSLESEEEKGTLHGTNVA
jgi:hypothetical protein